METLGPIPTKVTASKYRLADVGIVPRKVGKPQDRRDAVMQTNHYELVVSNMSDLTKVYLYALKVNPEIPLDNRQLRRQLIEQLVPQVEGTLGKFVMSGHVLFAKKCNESVIVFETKVGNIKYDVNLNIIRDRKDTKSEIPKPKCLNLDSPEEKI